MKKFIATVLLLMFTSLSANATTQVFFGNTGRPVSYSRGFHRSSMHNFGSNAAFTPANRAYAGFRNRQIKRQKAITKAIAATAQRSMPSTLSRNYTPTRTTTSYTRDGITYYN